MWFLLVLACTPAAPDSPEDCAALGDVTARDECYASVLPELFRTDPAGATRLVEQAVTDPTVKDYIWLAVTRDVDPNSNKYCDRIKDAVLAERCRVLVSRPHLHRGLVEGNRPPRAPMGGAPPGVANPPSGPVVPGGASNGSVPPPQSPP